MISREVSAMISRFVVIPDYNHPRFKYCYEVVDDSNNITICQVLRRDKANRICRALNTLQKRYPLYESK